VEITDFNTLTFDCYGTLIDWETGIADELRIWAFRHGLELSRDELLGAYGRHEIRIEHEHPDMLYTGILAAVHLALQEEFRTPREEEAAEDFGQSVPRWPAFWDTADALRYLKKHYKLVILSNVNRAAFAESNKRLGVEFDATVTAEDVGSYKPNPRNFDALLTACEALGVAKGEILHTAQSATHDIVPGRKFGLTTCWIDRRHDRAGWGATAPPPEAPNPDFTFTSMGAFAQHHAALTGA
jgi:2-haloacid dehalogenase